VRVVSDAGPLIHLARAGHFDLLQELFGRVLIPPAVYQLEAAISRMRDRGTWIDDNLVAAVLAASRRR